MIEEKILELKRKLVENATLVESMISKSIEGLTRADRETLKKVITEEEKTANSLEIELEEMCTAIIAQYQPMTRYLRTVLMAVKMTNDLERMADHAVNISESALVIIEQPPIKPFIDMPLLGKLVMNMVTQAVNSFIHQDTALAETVCGLDSNVDAYNDRILRELIALMTTDPSTVERAIHILRISNNLERIADLSTNICEEVIFMVEGRVIKHHHGQTT